MHINFTNISSCDIIVTLFPFGVLIIHMFLIRFCKRELSPKDWMMRSEASLIKIASAVKNLFIFLSFICFNFYKALLRKFLSVPFCSFYFWLNDSFSHIKQLRSVNRFRLRFCLFVFLFLELKLQINNLLPHFFFLVFGKITVSFSFCNFNVNSHLNFQLSYFLFSIILLPIYFNGFDGSSEWAKCVRSVVARFFFS